ncbi:MAG: hypothetical protein V4568_08390 [Pseudomonadota bacterium]
MEKNLEEMQMEICSKFKANFYGCDLNLKVGISRSAREGTKPIHGLRINPEKDTNGWYIWVGDWSDDPNFFVPLHGVHLKEWAPLVLPYLGLEPGWRFLITEDYEDVWKDPELLNNG